MFSGLLATLEARGYIEQNKVTENYRLGLKCLQLGQTFIHQLGLLLQARSTLEDLVKLTKESAFVAIRKGTAIVPLEFVEPRASRPRRFVSWGRRYRPIVRPPGKCIWYSSPRED